MSCCCCCRRKPKDKKLEINDNVPVESEAIKVNQIKLQEKEKEKELQNLEHNLEELEKTAYARRSEISDKNKQTAPPTPQYTAAATKQTSPRGATPNNTSNGPSTPPPEPCKGYLSKQGQVFRTWKARFFVLENGEIRYYDDETFQGSGEGDSDEPMGVPLFLQGYTATNPVPHRILITPSKDPTSRQSVSRQSVSRYRAVSAVEASHSGVARTLLLECKNDPAEVKRWTDALKAHIEYCNTL